MISQLLTQKLPQIIPRAISENEWYLKVQSFFKEKNDEYFTIETSKEDRNYSKYHKGFSRPLTLSKQKSSFVPLSSQKQLFGCRCYWVKSTYS